MALAQSETLSWHFLRRVLKFTLNLSQDIRCPTEFRLIPVGMKQEELPFEKLTFKCFLLNT